MNELTLIDDVPELARSLAFKGLENAEVECYKREQVECPVYHRFGPGIYMREVILPAGSFCIGHYQNFEHMNVMLTGRVTMLHEDGSSSELVAPMVFVGKPGRKMGYIHETVVWQNIYATDETDVEKLEAKYLTKSDAWQSRAMTMFHAEKLLREADREDYLNALQDLDANEDLVRMMSENLEDQIPMPLGSYTFAIQDSPIQGKGIFATADYTPGQVIGPARIDGKRTPLGRFTNHSRTPNAEMKRLDNGDILLIATSQIRGMKGGDSGEEVTVDYRSARRIALQKEAVCLE